MFDNKVAPVSTEEGVEVPILMYHEVKANNLSSISITPYEFEQDLKFIKDNDYTPVTMQDLINYVYYDISLPEKPIVLSFDDGYYNNYVYAFPLLKKYNVKIVLSIIGKSSDDFTKICDENVNYSHMSWKQVNEMINANCAEVQNHTYNLHKITKIRYGAHKKWGESLEEYEKVLSDDVEKCQQAVAGYTGTTPNTFTYPYGSISKESIPVLKKLGFKAALTCKYGINILRHDPEQLFQLKRISRRHKDNIGKIIEKAKK
ncbi:MAG: polysaccharide deacetylase family protein [Bacillota bacterium]|nr:polysaccharide deacetylase family protein [Bacillota bacterium]